MKNIMKTALGLCLTSAIAMSAVPAFAADDFSAYWDNANEAAIEQAPENGSMADYVRDQNVVAAKGSLGVEWTLDGVKQSGALPATFSIQLYYPNYESVVAENVSDLGSAAFYANGLGDGTDFLGLPLSTSQLNVDVNNLPANTYYVIYDIKPADGYVLVDDWTGEDAVDGYEYYGVVVEKGRRGSFDAYGNYDPNAGVNAVLQFRSEKVEEPEEDLGSAEFDVNWGVYDKNGTAFDVAAKAPVSFDVTVTYKDEVIFKGYQYRDFWASEKNIADEGIGYELPVGAVVTLNNFHSVSSDYTLLTKDYVVASLKGYTETFVVTPNSEDNEIFLGFENGANY